MQNIVMETHQGIITSRYSLLTTLNKVCGPLQLGINFKRLVGLKISLVKFTYPMGISGLGGGGSPSLPHYSLLMLLLISQWTKGLGVIKNNRGQGAVGQSCLVRAHENFSQINTIYHFPVSSRNIYKADYTVIIINRFVADIFPLNPSSFTLFPEVSFHNFSILPRNLWYATVSSLQI